MRAVVGTTKANQTDIIAEKELPRMLHNHLRHSSSEAGSNFIQGGRVTHTNREAPYPYVFSTVAGLHETCE